MIWYCWPLSFIGILDAMEIDADKDGEISFDSLINKLNGEISIGAIIKIFLVWAVRSAIDW